MRILFYLLVLLCSILSAECITSENYVETVYFSDNYVDNAVDIFLVEDKYLDDGVCKTRFAVLLETYGRHDEIISKIRNLSRSRSWKKSR